MHNGNKIADVVPITTASDARQDFGTFTAHDGSTVQVVHVRDKVKMKVTSKVGVGDGVVDTVIYLDFDPKTALLFQVGIGMAAFGASGHALLDPKDL